MPLDIAGTPVWHEIINSPATAELGNQAAFAGPFTQVKDNLNWLKAFTSQVQAFSALIDASSAFSANSGNIATFAPFDLALDAKCLIVANIRTYTAPPGNNFQCGALLDDLADTQYGPGVYIDGVSSFQATWWGLADVPAGTYTPRITYNQGADSNTLLFHQYNYAHMAVLIFPQGGS